LLPAGAIAGWVLHPLESAAFPRRTPDTGIVLMLEYEDMAAYGARTAFEAANAEWQRLFEPAANAPETLVSVELLTEVPPGLGDPDGSERVPFGFRPG
jgi:hypothetical protein